MFCWNIFPLQADIYYPTTSQTNFGVVEKAWTLDQTVRLGVAMTTNYKDQQIQPDQMFWEQDTLGARMIVDPRVASDSDTYAMTDVLVTNIRTMEEVEIYLETAGPRSGSSTAYELSGVLPHVGPFGAVDYYKVTLKRSDDQEVL